MRYYSNDVHSTPSVLVGGRITKPVRVPAIKQNAQPHAFGVV